MRRTSPDFHVGPRLTRHYWLHDFLNETGRQHESQIQVPQTTVSFSSDRSTKRPDPFT